MLTLLNSLLKVTRIKMVKHLKEKVDNMNQKIENFSREMDRVK